MPFIESFIEKIKQRIAEAFPPSSPNAPPTSRYIKNDLFTFEVEAAFEAARGVTVIAGFLHDGTLEIGKPFNVPFTDGMVESFPIWRIDLAHGLCRSISVDDRGPPLPVGVAFAPEYRERLPIDRILTPNKK